MQKIIIYDKELSEKITKTGQNYLKQMIRTIKLRNILKKPKI